MLVAVVTRLFFSNKESETNQEVPEGPRAAGQRSV